MTTKTKPFSVLADRIMADSVRRARIEERRRVYETALRLVDLRGERGLTQTALAAKMRVSQKRVSTIERQGNPQVETLRRYVAALGADLEITAVFPDGRAVPIAEIPINAER